MKNDQNKILHKKGKYKRTMNVIPLPLSIYKALTGWHAVQNNFNQSKKHKKKNGPKLKLLIYFLINSDHNGKG